MMKTALVLSGVLLLSCSQGRDAEPSDMDVVKAQRDIFCATFDPQTVERCDRITFVALMSAACGRDYGLAQYEENGKWHRDQSHACYQEGESKSECSRDSYLSVLHAAHALRLPLVPRMRDALEKSDWLCGEGPEGVTSIRPLKSVIDHMAGVSSLADDDALAETFQGHLLVSYLWLRHKLGLVSPLKTVALQLASQAPRSPFYPALAGDEAWAVRNLMDFPAPYSQWWGSAPDSVVYAASVAAMEGR